MIINKTTSNAIVVSSLVLIKANGKPIKNVTEFDTDTLIATISGGPATDTAAYFKFVVSTDEDMAVLAVELPQELHPTVSFKPRYGGKRAMDDSDTLPDECFTVISAVSPCLVECSNCGVIFLVFFGNNKVWGTAKPSPSDKNFTLVELDADNITCDNCSVSAAIFEPMG